MRYFDKKIRRTIFIDTETEGGMKMAKLSDLLDAFMFVSSDMHGINRAVFCRDTGKILWQSELSDVRELEEAETCLDTDNCIDVPHKNDLDLGQKLVFEFIENNLPEKIGYVEKIFRKSGAYSRLKELLAEKGLLEKWYDFESSAEEKALRQWCTDNGIKLDD